MSPRVTLSVWRRFPERTGYTIRSEETPRLPRMRIDAGVDRSSLGFVTDVHFESRVARGLQRFGVDATHSVSGHVLGSLYALRREPELRWRSVILIRPEEHDEIVERFGLFIDWLLDVDGQRLAGVDHGDGLTYDVSRDPPPLWVFDDAPARANPRRARRNPAPVGVTEEFEVRDDGSVGLVWTTPLPRTEGLRRFGEQVLFVMRRQGPDKQRVFVLSEGSYAVARNGKVTRKKSSVRVVGEVDVSTGRFALDAREAKAAGVAGAVLAQAMFDRMRELLVAP